MWRLNIYFEVFIVCQIIFLTSSFHLQINSYTGSGISQQLGKLIHQTIDKSYAKYGRFYMLDQTDYMTAELQKVSGLKFTVAIISENPADSWFMSQTIDEMYAIWPGVNKFLPAWTYIFFGNGKTEDNMTRDHNYPIQAGKGISDNLKQTIKITISQLQKESCAKAGNGLGKNLTFATNKKWSSMCRPYSKQDPWYGTIVSQGNQYYFGKGQKCECMAWVSLKA